MPWAALDDAYPDNPKVVKVGPLGMALHTAATCYCARHLTDGFVPAAMIPRLLSLDGLFLKDGNAVTHALLTRSLVDAGLFEEVEGGYNVHDYLDYNPSAAEVKAKKEATRARVEAFRRRKEQKAGGNAVTNALVTVPPPLPSPPLINNNNLGNEGVLGGEESPRPPALPRLRTGEIDYENLTPLQAMELPEMQIYRDATGMFPGRPLYRLVTETIRAHKFTADKLRPFWVEWNARGFRVNNLAWLTEWACAGAIPEKIQAGRNGSGKKSTREQLLEAIHGE